MLLSIVIPVFNERNLVTQLLRKILDLKLEEGMEKEVIVVDDGSRDGTREVLEAFAKVHESAPLKILHHQINRGKGAAVRTGFLAATGDILIIQDADLEYDPQDILHVVKPISKGQAWVVYGSRILMEKALGRSGFMGLITGKHPHSYVLAYLGGVAITQWTNILSGARLTDEPTCYKCFHRRALDGIEIESDDFAWEPEVTMKLLRKALVIHEVPISYHPRRNQDGKKINWKDGVKALWAVWCYR